MTDVNKRVKDELLSAVAAMGLTGKLEIPLTVFTKGLIFTGKVASFKDFWDHLQSLSAEDREELIEPPSRVDPDGVEFFYLKDCKVLSPGSVLIPSKPMVVRIQMSSVDAWTWGCFQ